MMPLWQPRRHTVLVPLSARLFCEGRSHAFSGTLQPNGLHPWVIVFTPQGDICQCQETFLFVTTETGDMLLVSGGWRPAMLLNASLPCPAHGTAPHRKELSGLPTML